MPETLTYISRHALKQPWIVSCRNCTMIFRVENLTPFTMAKRALCCPACGSPDIEEKSDYATDKWYAMAEELGLPRRKGSTELIKQLYSLWDPQEYEWFKDFVASVIAEAKAEAGV